MKPPKSNGPSHSTQLFPMSLPLTSYVTLYKTLHLSDPVSFSEVNYQPRHVLLKIK